MNSQTDLYQQLGLSDNASLVEIKRAYRKLALQHHPDISGDNGEEFKRLVEVYNTLNESLNERKLAILDNLRRCSELMRFIPPEEKSFIARFLVGNGKTKYLRPVPFGYKLIEIESITTNEFNKLHRIAYKPWR